MYFFKYVKDVYEISINHLKICLTKVPKTLVRRYIKLRGQYLMKSQTDQNIHQVHGCKTNYLKTPFPFELGLFCLFGGTRIELRASHLHGWCSITWASSSPFWFSSFSGRVSHFSPRASVRSQSSYLHLHSWNHRHGPACLVYWLRWNLANFLPRLKLHSSQSLPPK
jgi:hypothetical protein